MRKAILISIRPEWVAKIIAEEKTIEIRKTAPKCKLPIDVYIYVTRGQALKRAYLYEDCVQEGDIPFYVLGCFREDSPNYYFPEELDRKGYLGNGYVIAKFTLNKIENFINGMNELELEWDGKPDAEYDYFAYEKALEKACLTYEEADKYCPGQSFYAWKISDLQIFDEPKELSNFFSIPETYHHDHESMVDYYERKEARRLKRAPRSWSYIEVE